MDAPTAHSYLNTPDPLVYTIPQCARLLMISDSLCYKQARARAFPGVLHIGARRMVVAAGPFLRWLNGGEQAPLSDGPASDISREIPPGGGA